MLNSGKSTFTASPLMSSTLSIPSFSKRFCSILKIVVSCSMAITFFAFLSLCDYGTDCFERSLRMDIQVGDIVKLKKKHPCGSFEWEVLRIGADFRLKCKGCGHQIMIARKIVEKNTKDLKKKA